MKSFLEILQEAKDHLIKKSDLTDEQKEKAINFFKTYPNYEKELKDVWGTPKKITWDRIEKVMNLAQNSNSKQKLKDKEKIQTGENLGLYFMDPDKFKIFKQTKDYILVAPLSHKACVFMDSFRCFNHGAKWCIGWNGKRRNQNQDQNVAEEEAQLEELDNLNFAEEEAQLEELGEFDVKPDVHWKNYTKRGSRFIMAYFRIINRKVMIEYNKHEQRAYIWLPEDKTSHECLTLKKLAEVLSDVDSLITFFRLDNTKSFYNIIKFANSDIRYHFTEQELKKYFDELEIIYKEKVIEPVFPKEYISKKLGPNYIEMDGYEILEEFLSPFEEEEENKNITISRVDEYNREFIIESNEPLVFVGGYGQDELSYGYLTNKPEHYQGPPEMLEYPEEYAEKPFIQIIRAPKIVFKEIPFNNKGILDYSDNNYKPNPSRIDKLPEIIGNCLFKYCDFLEFDYSNFDKMVGKIILEKCFNIDKEEVEKRKIILENCAYINEELPENEKQLVYKMLNYFYENWENLCSKEREENEGKKLRRFEIIESMVYKILKKSNYPINIVCSILETLNKFIADKEFYILNIGNILEKLY